MIMKTNNKIFSIFRNRDLFDIKSFVFVFTTYSLISIWFSHMSTKQDEKIYLKQEQVKLLKAEYVISKTVLMETTKHSTLLNQAKRIHLYPPEKPLTIINLKYEE